MAAIGTYEGVAAVAADGDLRLVGVDEDLGVASGAAATLAGDNPAVRPLDRNLVYEHHRRVGLWLPRAISLFLWPFMCFSSSSYLFVEVGLFETRAGHGLRTRLLAARPGFHAVGSLVDHGRLVLVNRRGRGL